MKNYSSYTLQTEEQIIFSKRVTYFNSHGAIFAKHVKDKLKCGQTQENRKSQVRHRGCIFS